MANARKCDKCKRCFDPCNESRQMVRFRNPVFQRSNEIQENVIGELLLRDSNTDAICDLCPECTAMFKMFMRNPNSVVTVPNPKPVFDNRPNKSNCVGYRFKGVSEKRTALADLVNSMFNLGADTDGD